jgi:hypothetical protein
MAWAVSSSAADEQANHGSASLPQPTAAVPPITETIVVEPEPVEVEALPGSIVRALENAGNLRNEDQAELALSPSILHVLADHDVVLRVNEGLAP